MKHWILALNLALLLSGTSVTLAQDTGTDRPQSATALDFLIGVWHTVGGVPQEDGSYTQRPGMLIGEAAFQGTEAPAIMVRTHSLPHARTGDNPFGIRYFEDLSVYVFHPEAGTWSGVAHNTLGNRKWRDFVAADETEVVFFQSGELFQGVAGDIRFTYYNISENHFDMRIDYRPSPDADWQMGTYRMSADRLG